jgi:predicted transcriptional regulator
MTTVATRFHQKVVGNVFQHELANEYGVTQAAVSATIRREVCNAFEVA